MGIRFRKSIKLGSLIKLNITKTGVSVTAGKNGASINLGKNGTFLNLSPVAAGVKGTGVSYRKKIASGYGDITKNIIKKEKTSSKDTKETFIKEENNTPLQTIVPSQTNEELTNYKKYLEENTNIHKYADNVLSKEDFSKQTEQFESDASKEIYRSSINGDEEIIESLFGAFLNKLDLNYKVDANYELENHTLYIDLDLPEIEELKQEYPTIKNETVTYKKKTVQELKEEYAKTVLSLGVYVSANGFNVSSYIDEIVISGFTSRRNNDGDLVDDYLYSVKYLRKEFEKTDLSKLDNVYVFLLKFENRINLSNIYSFKAIKPYEMASVTKTNSLIDDALAGLKELGYKTNDINNIIPELNKLDLKTSGEYIKEALKLLQK